MHWTSMTRRAIAILFVLALPPAAAEQAHEHGTAILEIAVDGGTLSIEDWRGRPVLVVNTASQ